MPAARVLAQAKINVWLHVLGPRPDGFHDLLTLFQRLELADEIIVRASNAATRSLDVSGPRLPRDGLGPEKENLVYRAAVAFHAAAGWPRGFEIALTKRIPVGGGLGGGSADAGCVLRALNALAPRPLDAPRLHAIAATLGSDVPFFVTEEVAAVAAGRGEALRGSLAPMPAADVLLVVPSFGIATTDAYRWLRESGRYQATHDRRASTSMRPTPRPWSALNLGNTFEPVVEEKYPELANHRTRLIEAGATIARLSGSGSTVFGLFESGAPGERTLGIDALVIRTRTAENVVQVEVRE
ncbi:MAG: 4-(cytidine 5'-diphospho)-2-C-methyl-D-erythritol kinase [Gemmatimonadaceae bacterium]